MWGGGEREIVRKDCVWVENQNKWQGRKIWQGLRVEKYLLGIQFIEEDIIQG